MAVSGDGWNLGGEVGEKYLGKKRVYRYDEIKWKALQYYNS